MRLLKWNFVIAIIYNNGKSFIGTNKNVVKGGAVVTGGAVGAGVHCICCELISKMQYLPISEMTNLPVPDMQNLPISERQNLLMFVMYEMQDLPMSEK